MSALEEWRTIPGWEGLYEASSRGRIRSLDRIGKRRSRGGNEYTLSLRGKVLRANDIGHGYPGVQLYANDGVDRPRNRRMIAVHILVCEAFHGERPKGMEVAHRDGDKANPAAANLRWATKLENHADKRRHGTTPHGSNNPSAKLTWDEVAEIRASKHLRRRDLAQRFGVSVNTVQAIINNRRWVSAP